MGEQAIQQPLTTTPTPPTRKPGVITGIFLFFLGIAFGLALGKTSFISALRIPYLTATPTPIPSPTEALKQVDTSNWKTYVNNKNLYAVKIPPGWTPSRGNPRGGYTDEELQELDRMYWSKNNSSFSVDVLKACTNLEICFREFQTTADANANTFGARHTTKGFETTKGTFQSVPSIESRSMFGESVNVVKGIFFVYNDKLWLLQTESLPSLKEADQILSTFKFVDQTTTTYTCPPNGWVNCMPILTPEAQSACSAEAIVWYKANCPDFKGVAQ